MRGIIEGFYGAPWTWDERHEVASWCAARDMDTYVYAPKDDPKHRESWRDSYTSHELAEFERFVAAGHLRLGFAVSPGLTIDADDPADVAALIDKCRAVQSVGAGLVVLAVDDIPPAPGLGTRHGELVQRMTDALATEVVIVPTDYTSTRPTTYLDDLHHALPESTRVAWTGPTVVCDEITVDQAVARAAAVGGRAPVLWDNYPVNDAIMADRLFLGPLRGRSAALLDHLDGYVANPMVQARANLLPLASTAAWLRGDDPLVDWTETADELGWRTFAEACDGAVPLALVDAVVAGESGAVDALTTWLTAARTCEAPGLEAAGVDWLRQVREDAALALDALAGSTDAFTWLGVLSRWRRAQGACVSVLGPRFSLRPVVGQDDQGGFVAGHPGASLDRDRNALDRLLAHLIA